MKYYIGIDVGGMSIKAGVVNEDGILLNKKSVPTLATRPSSEIVSDMANLCKTVAADAELSLKDIDGIGIGIPGMIDSENGTVVYCNNIPFVNFPLKVEFEKLIPLPLKISNDANVAALGETKFGGGKNAKNTLLITLGTGVGSGIVIDGKLFEGRKSAGAELGHTIIVMNGEPCSCGRRGCLEAYASASALIRETKKAIAAHNDSKMFLAVNGNLDAVDGRTAFSAAKQGDKYALEVIEKYIFALSEGIVDFINIFRPEIVMLGGGVCAEGEYLLKPIREHVAKYSYGGSYAPDVKIVKATLGNDAGIIGAAALLM